MNLKTRTERIEVLENIKIEIINEYEQLFKRAKTMEKLKLSNLSEQLGVVRTTDFNKLSDRELDRIINRLKESAK